MLHLSKKNSKWSLMINMGSIQFSLNRQTLSKFMNPNNCVKLILLILTVVFRAIGVFIIFNQCTYGTMQSGFVRNQSLETLKLSVSNNDSNVHVYPNAAHNPYATVLCLTRDNSISYMRLRKTERDAETGKTVDIFIFCSKSNSTQYSCKYSANLDHMYKITISKNIKMKIYKRNKSKNKNCN